jgi:hypothetical protein
VHLRRRRPDRDQPHEIFVPGLHHPLPLHRAHRFHAAAQGVRQRRRRHPNDCHYSSGNFHARRRWIVFRGLLDLLGIDVRRVQFSWVSAAEGAKWAQLVNETAEHIRGLGPFAGYQRLRGSGIE